MDYREKLFYRNVIPTKCYIFSNTLKALLQRQFLMFSKSNGKVTALLFMVTVTVTSYSINFVTVTVTELLFSAE